MESPSPIEMIQMRMTEGGVIRSVGVHGGGSAEIDSSHKVVNLFELSSRFLKALPKPLSSLLRTEVQTKALTPFGAGEATSYFEHLSYQFMAHLQHPAKPLKILTIDGGGLQAISTLLVLDKLLKEIAKNATGDGRPKKKPRPCDVFDTIAGIGAGGWLALFLGRFHMDIQTCLTEWYDITQAIAPKSKTEGFKARVLQHRYFNTERLVQRIEQLTKVRKTGDNLRATDNERTRCKHVFVAALGIDARGKNIGYNLFRTYKAPTGGHVRAGPDDYRICDAFGVTGAAKYFTPPWKGKDGIRFFDTKFPQPHNITDIALDEMWALYGTDVRISVVVNIGPGLPSDSDFKQISRRFSWGRNPNTVVKPSSKRSRSTVLPDVPESERQMTSDLGGNGPQDKSTRESHVHFGREGVKPGVPTGANIESDKIPLGPRTNTYGSLAERKVKEKLRRLESHIEEDIKLKLKNVYPDNTPPYYRLAPEVSPKGAAQNDASAPSEAYDATINFVESPQTSTAVEEMCQNCHFEDPVSA